MILIVFAALCLISVPLTGGDLRRLGDIQLRLLWLAPLAIGLQVIITVIITSGSPTLHSAAHIVSYVFAGLFLWANRRLPGSKLIAAGAGMNALAIIVNGGVMPASATAQRIAGLHLGHGFNNSAYMAHAHLTWLGDIIPFPIGPAALHNVLSPGDCVLYLGMLVLLHRICRRPAPAPAQVEPVSVAPIPVIAAAQMAAMPTSTRTSRAENAYRGDRGRGTLAPVALGVAALVVLVGAPALAAARNR